MATVRSPSNTCSDATRARFGTRSVRSGAIARLWTASRPTSIVLSSSRGTPATARTSSRRSRGPRRGPPASVAVVVNEVPKSIARSQPAPPPRVTPSRRPSRRDGVRRRGRGTAGSCAGFRRCVGVRGGVVRPRRPRRRAGSSVRRPASASSSPSPSSGSASPTTTASMCSQTESGSAVSSTASDVAEQACGRRATARCPGRCRGSATCPARRPDQVPRRPAGRPPATRSRRLLSVGGQPAGAAARRSPSARCGACRRASTSTLRRATALFSLARFFSCSARLAVSRSFSAVSAVGDLVAEHLAGARPPPGRSPAGSRCSAGW